MKKLYLFVFLLIPYFAVAQIDTAHYLTKPFPTTMRTDTTATNLLTYNQTSHQADLMSGATLKSYFQSNIPFSGIVVRPTTLLGYGITDGASTSGLIYNVLSKSANYTILSSDFNTAYLKVVDLYVDATSGPITITMPSALAGYGIYITKTDASANAVTASGVTGNNTITTQTQSRFFQNNTVNWYNH